jgi:hypothetical protein
VANGSTRDYEARSGQLIKLVGFDDTFLPIWFALFRGKPRANPLDQADKSDIQYHRGQDERQIIERIQERVHRFRHEVIGKSRPWQSQQGSWKERRSHWPLRLE